MLLLRVVLSNYNMLFMNRFQITWFACLPYDLNLFVMTASAYLEPKDEVHDLASLRHAFLGQVDKPL
jgi:hypothetical protein